LGSESKELLMNMKNRTGCIIIALLLCGTAPALAQTTPSTPQHIQLQKTIGEQDKPEIVPSLIVMNARGASLQGGKLTLTGVAPNSIVFADRPVRAAGHSLLTNLLEEWSPSNDSDESFTKDPPNATVSVFSTDGSKVRDAVVVLKTAKLEGDRLTFDVDVLEGELAGGDGPAALFIDRFGFGGFRGVLRVRMGINQRKIAESKTQVIAQALLELFHHRIRLAAIWALVIAILEQHDRRINRPLNVVPIRHWQCR